jgi:hypothetical protein
MRIEMIAPPCGPYGVDPGRRTRTPSTKPRDSDLDRVAARRGPMCRPASGL